MKKLMVVLFFIVALGIFAGVEEENFNLLQGVSEGDIKACDKALQAGAEIDYLPKNSVLLLTPVVRAAMYGDLEIVKYLIKQGANEKAIGVNPNCERKNMAIKVRYQSAGNIITRVCEALSEPRSQNHEYDYVNTIEYLRKMGVECNVRNSRGSTPFMLAARAGNIKIMEKLAKYGAYLDEQNNRGETALMIAVMHGKYDAAKWLLENGANPNKRDYENYSVLDKVVLFDLKKNFSELVIKYRGKVYEEDKGVVVWAKNDAEWFAQSMKIEEFKN